MNLSGITREKVDRSDTRPTVVLDIDNTLFHAIDIRGNICRNKVLCWNMDNLFLIYPRPYLRFFLKQLVKSYKIAIWSAGTREYVRFIVESVLYPHFLKDLPDFDRFEFVWSLDQCEESKSRYDSLKSLRYLLDERKELSAKNVMMIDDCVLFSKHFNNNLINVPLFDITKFDCMNDSTLSFLITEDVISDRFKELNKSIKKENLSIEQPKWSQHRAIMVH